MKAAYIRAMDALHGVCMAIAGLCLVVITLIIPWGVFTRYVLNIGSSWPEPMAVFLMIWFSFMSAALCYREGLHIGVKVIPDLLGGTARIVIGWLIEACMAFTNLFMLVWGIRLVQTTWYSTLADFPLITAGFSYLPVPLGGAITTLFVIERLWNGDLFAEPDADAISHIATE
ncbi:MAG: TRAP-type C4-dicarboxylate transport system, small permease component [uncultured Microvirga sp.]|uniref:TRAP transporter small permease protein n=1 Tax=uncultured Microvirga sp. TaxID=412392 RepID=A0A6J4LW23_9HYPH|nr:MAG: TRAP-type C4-dicarboxylate transport system, small permease component [uncultured Microvirga sp.]